MAEAMRLVKLVGGACVRIVAEKARDHHGCQHVPFPVGKKAPLPIRELHLSSSQDTGWPSFQHTFPRRMICPSLHVLGEIMVFQALGYVAAVLLFTYLAYWWFGAVLTDRSRKRRQWAIEQAQLHYERVAEYERRKASGMKVGAPPQMSLLVATMIRGGPSPLY